jgi:hypothetical protein
MACLKNAPVRKKTSIRRRIRKAALNPEFLDVPIFEKQMLLP